MPDADDVQMVGLDPIDDEVRSDGMNPHWRRQFVPLVGELRLFGE